jgi:hypothetical protein
MRAPLREQVADKDKGRFRGGDNFSSRREPDRAPEQIARPVIFPAGRLHRTGKLMTNDPDRVNDTRLITPLVLMALVIAGGFLFAAYHGSGAANVAQAPVQQTAAH